MISKGGHETELKMLTDFMPLLVNAIDGCIHRLKIRDMVSILVSFQKINSLKIASDKDMNDMHLMANKYLVEVISK